MIRQLFTLLTVLLAGCASMPNDVTLPDEKDLAEELIKEWQAKAPDPISYVPIGGGLVASAPQQMPKALAATPFKTSFSESMKLKDLHAFLKPFGLSLVIPDDELRERTLVIFEFQGELGNFLRALGIAYGISFNWHPGNILTAEASSQYLVKVPQDKDVMAEIAGAIQALGAESITSSMSAGSISYRATYDVHQRIIHYMEEVSVNAAVITLQAAIVTVAMDRNRDSGFDWSQLQAKVGAVGIDDGGLGLFGEEPSGEEGGEGEEGESGAPPPIVVDGVNGRDLKSLFVGSQQGAGLVLKKGDLDLRAVIRLLSTYGETETTQSVLLKTLSGKPVKLDSSQQIPYVSEIGGSTNASAATGVNNTSRVQIEDLNVGLMLDLAPYFDAHTGLVTVGVDVELSSLISFVEISAGNDIGNITRPNTQKQLFTDMLRLMPGQSVIIGGLMYDQVSDKRSGISLFDRLPLASRSRSSTRNALFILLRPTVTIFRSDDETEGKD